MSEAIKVERLPASIARQRMPLVRVATSALLVYPILLAWFTTPSRFLKDDSYEAKLHGPQISSRVLPLELPKDEAELSQALKTYDSRVHDAQVELFRVAQAWDKVFIEIYVLQFVAMALLAEVTGLLGWIRALAVAAIATAGIFDWLENRRIDDILNQGYPQFGKLISQVTEVSTVKWVSLFIAFSLLAPVLWKLDDSPKFRIALAAALVAASISGFIGVLVWPHALIGLAMGLYGIVPLLILWRFAVKPAIDFIDAKLRARAAHLVAEAPESTEEEAQEWSLDTLEKPSGAATETHSSEKEKM